METNMSSTANSTGLRANGLRNDPRLAEAKQLILDVVAEHQQDITEVRAADESLKAGYQQTLDAFGGIRGNNLYFPYLASGLGNGPFVELGDGSVKLDFITGIGVHGFGHSHPLMVETGIDAAVSDTVMQGNLQQAGESYDMVKLLSETACESGAKLNHCFLSSSGAMANENALKMAFQKKHPANRIIAFSHCFAGRTLALSAVTDKAKNRVGQPDTIDVDYIPFLNHEDPEKSTRSAVKHLKNHIHRHPGKHAALWMELVQGEGGYYEGSHEFFKALIDVAHKNGIATIADEVQTFCRTTRPYAFQHYGLDEMIDLVTIGKISQVCATLFTPEFNPKPGLISQTFTGATWSIMAGHAIVKNLIDGGHFGARGRNVELHSHFVRGLKAIGEKHPGSVSGPFGVGGMIGFTPFDGSFNRGRNLVNRLFDAGLMSFFAGTSPTRLRFLIPLGCVETEHIDQSLAILDRVIGETA